MDVTHFCKTLREQPSRANDFSQFITYLRNLRYWQSQEDIRNDPLVIAAYGEIGAQSFPRILDRVAREMRASPETLSSLAIIFKFDNTQALIDFFEKWAQEQSQIVRLPGSKPHLLADASGYYVFPQSTVITGQSGARYTIQNYRASGSSRGLSFKAKALDSREYVFVKTLRIHESMNHQERKAHIDHFTNFVQRELKSLQHLRQVDGVAQIKDYGFVDLAISPFTYRVPFIATRFLNGEDLRTALTRRYGSNLPFKGCADGSVWVAIATQLLKILRSVHSRGIRHGALRPEKIMISADEVFMVDFGESGMAADVRHPETNGAESSAAPPPYTAPERIRHRELPLEEAEDIYGLGAILFWLACGRDLERDHIRSAFDLRKYIGEKVNEDLKTYNEGIIHVITECLHYRPADRMAHADDALRMLETFEKMKGRSTDFSIGGIYQELSALTAAVKDLPMDPLFGDMIRRDLAHMARRITDMMSAGRAEVVGTRNEIIQSLLGFLSILEPGDEYLTTSSLGYWMPDNLGISGRFLCANKMLGLQGVNIRRIIVMTKKEEDAILRGFAVSEGAMLDNSPSALEVRRREKLWAEVVRAQATIAHEVSLAMPPNSNDPAVARWRTQSYYAGYCSVDDSKKTEILQDGYHIGIIRKKNGSPIVSLSFQEMGSSETSDNVVRKIYVWNVEGEARYLIEKRLEKMYEYFDGSEPLFDLLPQAEQRRLRDR